LVPDLRSSIACCIASGTTRMLKNSNAISLRVSVWLRPSRTARRLQGRTIPTQPQGSSPGRWQRPAAPRRCMEVQLELNAVRIVDEELPDGKTRHAPLAKGYAEGAATLARVDKSHGPRAPHGRWRRCTWARRPDGSRLRSRCRCARRSPLRSRALHPIARKFEGRPG